jgi:hypothetical protein
MTSHPASAGPMELKAQIDKLSTDLVEVYEALTMVYGSVAVLGGLFAFEEITGYLVERSVDALLASGAALYLAQQDGTLTCVAQHEGLAAHIASHGPRALLDKRRAMFHNGEAAATVLTGGSDAVQPRVVAVGNGRQGARRAGRGAAAARDVRDR